MKRPTAAIYYAWSILELLARVRRPMDMIRLFLSNRLPKDGLMRLRRKSLVFRIRSRMDAWSVKEAVIDRFYERKGMRIADDWTVVDIGAAIGEFTVAAACRARAGMVYAFEPNQESVRILRENLDLNHLRNVLVNQCGVWGTEAQLLSLEMGNAEPLQAISVETAPENCEDGLSFDVITLAQVVEDVVQGDVDLLKLDCEGAEYAILEATGPATFKRIRRISMEYHDLDTQRNHRLLKSLLEKQGYKVKRAANWVHRDIGYLYAIRAS